jgi:hypothetical protein
MSKATPYENEFGISLEVYPNGDAGKYRKLYDLEDAHTLVRGSFRHAGFSTTARGIMMLGFYSRDVLDPNMTWADYIGSKCVALEGGSLRDRIKATLLAEPATGDAMKVFSQDETDRVCGAIEFLDILDSGR